ncbi:high affinity immunoglobulin epsilon receptor subunit alpha isoform X2 [Dasypus novemcinctus]|uniref:high affinity immunoglobulin epsilon receptor subunit alpha isoform X2 n=1 Tax=Dasypus novemcinctus TaxID=9361 RepID=UPI000328B0EE|nr:high affinity immunoglobulin epsilon receptor subunit alpha isoform X2 [Dasypus novemcinctus]
MPASMGGPALLWIALLLFFTRNSIVSLDPPWNRIFVGEDVTLICNGDKSSEVNSTKWYHNGTISNVKTSSFDIVNATIENSGEYRCQNKNLKQSKPVHLEIFSDWLLLQASAEVVAVGKPILIRCHGWKNWNVFKVVYYKNGKALKYWYENHNISIAQAKLTDSGNYHCEGIIRQHKRASDALKITVKASENYHWLRTFVPFLVVILFIGDTGLLISTQKEFTSLLKIKRTRKGNRDPKEK